MDIAALRPHLRLSFGVGKIREQRLKPCASPPVPRGCAPPASGSAAMKRMLQSPPRRPAYFWWLLANALAACFAVLSWFVCLHVFRQIETPRNYGILAKLGRLPEIKGFQPEDAPAGSILGPADLYRKFFALSEQDTERVNRLLLRNYLTNSANPLVLTYIEGNYRIDKVRALEQGDFLRSGLVAAGQAMVKPDEASAAAPYPVLIEFICPGADAAAVGQIKPGEVWELRKSTHFASVLWVGKTQIDGDKALLLTVIPVIAGPYPLGEHSIKLEPPPRVWPEAGLPILK